MLCSVSNLESAPCVERLPSFVSCFSVHRGTYAVSKGPMQSNTLHANGAVKILCWFSFQVLCIWLVAFTLIENTIIFLLHLTQRHLGCFQQQLAQCSGKLRNWQHAPFSPLLPLASESHTIVPSRVSFPGHLAGSIRLTPGLMIAGQFWIMFWGGGGKGDSAHSWFLYDFF